MSTIRTERDVCVICGGIDEMPSGDCARCMALELLDLLERAYRQLGGDGAPTVDPTLEEIRVLLLAHGRLGGET